MPFAGYADFDACVRANSDKSDPSAFCAAIREAVEGVENEGIELAGHGKDDKKRLLLGVEVFAIGTHHPSQGETREWTSEDLDEIVGAFNKGVPDFVHVKLGHTSDGFAQQVAEQLGVPLEVVRGEGEEGDGQISLGQMVSLRRVRHKLIADLEVPDSVAQLIMKGYSTVSCELMGDYEGYPWVMSAVALLGAERPAVKDLAGLASAAVLVERKPSLVYAFSVDNVGRLVDQPNLEEVELALEESIKGKKGAQYIRQIWREIKSRWTKMRPHSEEEARLYAEQEFEGNLDALIRWAGGIGFNDCVSELRGKPGVSDPERLGSWLQAQAKLKGLSIENKEDAMKFQEEAVKALKMQEDASPEAVLELINGMSSALVSLKEMLGLGEEATPEEVVEKAKEELEQTEESATFKEAKAKLEKKIGDLEKENRTRHFKELVTGLNAIDIKPDDMAERLVTIEEKMGPEAATERLEEWKSAQAFAEQAGVMRRIGSSRNGVSETDLDKATEKHREEHPELTFAEAQTHVMKANPALYEKYLEEQEG